MVMQGTQILEFGFDVICGPTGPNIRVNQLAKKLREMADGIESASDKEFILTSISPIRISMAKKVSIELSKRAPANTE